MYFFPFHNTIVHFSSPPIISTYFTRLFSHIDKSIQLSIIQLENYTALQDIFFLLFQFVLEFGPFGDLVICTNEYIKMSIAKHRN